MSRNSIATALKFGAVVFLLFAFLFADGIGETSICLFGRIIREITAVFYDPSIQLMVALCLVCYLILFSILECRLSPHRRWRRLDNPDLWLSVMILLVFLRYVFTYQMVFNSPQVCVLVAGIFSGKVISTWVRWQNDRVEERMVWMVGLLICCFICAALLQPKITTTYQYHGITRWNGIWDNPNLCGLLMGAGLVLAVGQIIEARRWKIVGRKCWNNLSIVLFFFTVILCGIGLFKSYSRGAWLAVFGGLIYLTVQTVKSSRFSVWFIYNRLSLILITVSLLLLAFWQFRFSELRPAQRLFSVVDVSDFSWRNRVTAWNGAMHMIIDRPFIGFGWGQAESIYGKKYCTLGESAAIEMNDYFMLAISVGVPALICFVVYVSLCLRPTTPSHHLLLPERRGGIQTTYRAGALVLLVGFWFDGGLFKLPTTTIFWIFLELSRLESYGNQGDKAQVETTMDNKSTDYIGTGRQLHPTRANSNKEIWLRWVAWMLAIVALVVSALHLVPAHFPVSDRTLAMARKYLVQPKERADFEALAAQTIWHGQKLQVLLDHVELANYNRELINWQLDDTIYRNFVLSPVITGNVDAQFDWRRILWEEFYPRIRHESSPENAATIVARHLRERVTIADVPNLPQDAPTIWLRQITNAKGFQNIYVAALRSVGVPARLGEKGQAEFFDGSRWRIAPRAEVENSYENSTNSNK
jgi:O-antigen ligase